MKRIYLLIILITIWSCKQMGDYSIQIIKIDTQKSDSVSLSNIVSYVDKIILEANDSSLITRINEIETTNDYIFINDAGNRILQFDYSGMFVKQIGKQGRGPGEYNTIYNIASDSITKILFIDTYKKILCFDFSGRLLTVIKQESMPEFITVVGNKLWSISTTFAHELGNERYVNITRLIRYDFQGNSVDTLIVKKVYLDSQAGTTNPKSFFVSDLGRLQYIYYPVMLPEPLLRDTIYEIKENKLIPSVKLDFGEAAKIKNGKKQVHIGNVFKTTRYLFVEYNYNKIPILFCYDYLDDVKYYAKQGFFDDFFLTGNIQLRPLDLKTEKLYFFLDSFELIGKIEGISEISNPVLFLVTLKNN